MIKIFICDDEPFWIEKAHKAAAGYFNSRTEAEIYSFREPSELVNVLINKKEYADIVILDIDMPELSGFDIAEQIRDVCPETLLLFFTSHEQYVFEAFRFQPFRYIRKAYADDELRTALSAAEAVISKRSTRKLPLKTKDETVLADINDITYFETDRRRCNVHLNDGGVLNVGGTIKELVRLADSPDLVLVHSGAAVNVRYIKTYSGSDLTLEDGTRLPISRGRLGDVKAAVLRYWRNRI